MLLNETPATPVMYRDIMSAPINLMNPYGYMGYYGGFCGDYQRLKPIADDGFYKVEFTNARENRQTLKTAAKVVAFCLAIGMYLIAKKNIRKKGGFKVYMKNTWNTLMGKPKVKAKPKYTKWEMFCNKITSPIKKLFKIKP